MDGRKEVHKQIPFRKGAGSYDLIMPKFQKFTVVAGQVGKLLLTIILISRRYQRQILIQIGCEPREKYVSAIMEEYIHQRMIKERKREKDLTSSIL